MALPGNASRSTARDKDIILNKPKTFLLARGGSGVCTLLALQTGDPDFSPQTVGLNHKFPLYQTL